MRQLTIKNIRDLNPCYDPAKYLSEDWTGTVVDILEIEECPEADRVWVALRLVDRFTLEAFAIDCALRAYAAGYAASAAYAAGYAASAAASASAAADAAAADAAANAAHKTERQNQIDSLKMLLGVKL